MPSKVFRKSMRDALILLPFLQIRTHGNCPIDLSADLIAQLKITAFKQIFTSFFRELLVNNEKSFLPVSPEIPLPINYTNFPILF